MDAGEIFKAEFVGAMGAVPRTRFLHLSLRLLARSLGPIISTLPPTAPSLRRELFAALLAADLRCRMLTRPPASVRPYIGHRSICQDRGGLKANRIELHAFPCCSAADGDAFRGSRLRSIAGAFFGRECLAGPRLGG